MNIQQFTLVAEGWQIRCIEKLLDAWNSEDYKINVKTREIENLIDKLEDAE